MGIEPWLPARFTHALPQHQKQILCFINAVKLLEFYIKLFNRFSFTIDLNTYTTK